MHDNILPVITSVAVVMLLLAGSAQWRARNIGTLMNIGWTLAGNLSFMLNSIIWRDHTRNNIPVFCDISIKLQTGLQTGISAASLCITRRLASIASSRAISTSQRRKRINFWVDIGCGIGLPILVMGLSYIAQSRRFLIQEGYGCEFAADASVPGILLMLVWPLLLSVISSVYGGIAIYYFVSKRLEFRTLLRSSNSGLDTGQFIRLLCLASVDIAVAVPMDIYIITRNVANLLPYSWSEIHHDWSTVLTVPASYWLTNPQLVIDVALWRYLLPMLGFALFVLIGMTEESIGEYTRVALRIWHIIPGTQRRQPLLPPPVNLGSTVSRVNGSGAIRDPPRSPIDKAFDIEPYESSISPRFQDHNSRIGIKVEREIV